MHRLYLSSNESFAPFEDSNICLVEANTEGVKTKELVKKNPDEQKNLSMVKHLKGTTPRTCNLPREENAYIAAREILNEFLKKKTDY